MNEETFNEIKKKIWEEYRIESEDESEMGSYCNHKWMSISDILDIIKENFVY